MESSLWGHPPTFEGPRGDAPVCNEVHVEPVRPFNVSAVPRPRSETRRVPWEKLRAFSVDIEIGAGAGWHSIEHCKSHPQRHLVAIERTKNKFKKLKVRAENHKLPNLWPIHSDALWWLAEAPKNYFEKVFIFYPNPYPKNPAQRWVRMPFFAHLLELLKLGGTLTITTNSEPYRREALVYLSEYWPVQLIHSSIIPSTYPPRTHFEKKYLERGDTCWEVVCQKTGSSSGKNHSV